MTERSQEAAIINDHEGEIVELSNKKKARVRPFNMEERLSDKVLESLEKILTAILGQAMPLIAGGLTPEVLSKLDPLGAFRSCNKEASFCLTACVDVPLAQIPGPDMPLLVGAFVRQNFTHAELQSWADLLKGLATMVKTTTKNAGIASNSTSATPASSSSTTGTPDGANTPQANSNTGSGGA